MNTNSNKQFFSILFGFTLEFIVFNALHISAFFFLFYKPNILIRIIYYVILFLITKLGIILTNFLIGKLIGKENIVKTIFQRKKFVFFMCLYLLTSIGNARIAKDTMLFYYFTLCFWPYLIGWIIYRGKAKKLLALQKNETSSSENSANN